MGYERKTQSATGNSPRVAQMAWDRLASEQYVDQELLRQEIALSWKKCLRNNVDPKIGGNVAIHNDLPERAERHWKLLTVAKAPMRNLYDSVKGMGFVVLLTDAEGVILDIFGDRKMCNLSESLSLVHGTNCSEEAIGTTAPGLCLVQKRPVQVFFREHYCQLYHDWCCSAVPILDSKGELAATLDLSSADEKIHTPLLLSLVNATARAMEAELHCHQVQRDLKKSYYYFNMIVDSIPEALVFFDRHGIISRVNKTAAKMLGMPWPTVADGRIEVTFSDFQSVQDKLERGQGWAELTFRTQKGPVRVDAFLKSVGEDDPRNACFVGSLKEVKKRAVEGNTAVYSFDDLIFRSRKMDEMLQNARRVSLSDATVLIQGESGTGKELLAQAIHNHSPRRNAPFVAVNCAALPKDLIQSELFGYEEGSFTGARKGGKPGKFELADGGSIFLDEIGDMPLSVQANLLRVLQERQTVRVGGSRPIQLDVRVIAASNRNLPAEVEAGSFRCDVFYRLSVVSLDIPPLRARKEDIEVLLRHFVEKHISSQVEADSIRVSPQAAQVLAAHDWPGNVRELENTVIYFLNKARGKAVTVRDLPAAFGKWEENPPTQLRTLDEAEKETILETLNQCNSNVSLTAGILGITRATLYHKIARYGIKLRN